MMFDFDKILKKWLFHIGKVYRSDEGLSTMKDFYGLVSNCLG